MGFDSYQVIFLAEKPEKGLFYWLTENNFHLILMYVPYFSKFVTQK